MYTYIHTYIYIYIYIRSGGAEVQGHADSSVDLVALVPARRRVEKHDQGLAWEENKGFPFRIRDAPID